MVTRHELTDYQWQVISSLLPDPKVSRPGRPLLDHRPLLNGIFWHLKVGSSWRDIPEKYGPWQTIYHRFNNWRKDGTWNEILSYLQFWLDQEGLINWDFFCIDGSNIRAHKAAAGARKNTQESEEPNDHALGYSRGGFGSKIHLVSDGEGLPLSVLLTAGQKHEAPMFEETLDSVRVMQLSGPARCRPKSLAADKAYGSRKIRNWLRRKKIEAVIPLRKDERRRRKGRPLNFDRDKYRERNVVERCIGWIKENRAVATRYDKLAVNYLAQVKLAMIRLCLDML